MNLRKTISRVESGLLVLLFISLYVGSPQAVFSSGPITNDVSAFRLSSGDEVMLLGNKTTIPFDPGKAIYISEAVNEVLKSCTVTTRSVSIPEVEYKGVRIKNPDGRIIEAHIYPQSRNSYSIGIYTKKDGMIESHGKYMKGAYSLIAMLEIEK
jgi:hypothetical protein